MDSSFYFSKEYLVQTYVEKFKIYEKVFSEILPSHSVI